MNETTVPTATPPETDCAPATATTTAISSIPAPRASDWKVTIVRCPWPNRSHWRSLSSSKRSRWRSSWANERTVRIPVTVSSRPAQRLARAALQEHAEHGEGGDDGQDDERELGVDGEQHDEGAADGQRAREQQRHAAEHERVER